ncbi:MAG: D-alanyl-D-alanine carboxypeptidase [Cyanobacteriota bacterium]|nr:D-alanyl-D-alanine carboxypeptidase [Cyanobacteriota bacterium]
MYAKPRRTIGKQVVCQKKCLAEKEPTKTGDPYGIAAASRLWLTGSQGSERLNEVAEAGRMGSWFRSLRLWVALLVTLLMLWGGDTQLSATGETQSQVTTYLNQLAAQGIPTTQQGIWIQANDQVLVDHQGRIPLPAASLTKVATSLASLVSLGSDYRFITTLSANGSVAKGVLQGDLLVQGSADPFFVWEDAIAVGNALNQLGIRQVTGNLVVVGSFYMNFFPDPKKSGSLLQQGLNSQLWPPEAAAQFQTLPSSTPRPQVEILGSVQWAASPQKAARPLLQHASLPLVELVKRMNLYSNNLMADMLADHLGGAAAVAQIVAQQTGLPTDEIQLVNGSGLGVDNRLSARAAVALFLALDRYLTAHDLTVADGFAVVGQDEGVLEKRLLPALLVAKSGTLNGVSTLAGALPTQNQGILWFAILNQGADLVGLRTAQGQLLQNLLKEWGSPTSLPAQLTPQFPATDKTTRLQNLG